MKRSFYLACLQLLGLVLLFAPGLAQTPAQTPRATPSLNPKNDYTYSTGQWRAVMTTVNCREKPNYSAKPIHVYKKGDTINIEEIPPGNKRNWRDSRGRPWLRVKTPEGKTGWIRANGALVRRV